MIATVPRRAVPPAPHHDGVLPLRPLTLGELLDAGIGLLRRHAVVLLVAGAVLAVAEQALLAPLRALAGTGAPWYWADTDHLAAYWLLIAAGLATEAAAIALLGGLAARAAGPELLGT